MKPSVPVANPLADSVIDADILAWLDAGVTPEPIDPLQQARIKSRLLKRVAEDSTAQHLTVMAEAGHWKPLPGGLSIKVLHRHEGVMSYLVRMAPGSVLAPHRHPIDEECVVLEGAVRIAGQRVGAGGFHLGRQSVVHDVIDSEEGALLFLRGAVPVEALAL